MTRASIVIALLFCTTLGAAAFADDAALRKQLEARYQEMKSAMASNDSDAVAAILAPGFQSIDISGRSETAAQMAAEVKLLKPDANKVSKTTLVSIKPAGSTAVVGQQYDMKTLRNGPDGAAHSFEMITVSTDTWTKVRGSWLLNRTVTDEVSVLTDGKLVAHKIRS